MSKKHPKLVSVKVKGGNFKKALSIFKRKVRESGHLLELRERTQYLKPSIHKRKQKQQQEGYVNDKIEDKQKQQAIRKHQRWVQVQKKEGLL